ncbi:Golgi-associated plant pathogenesis-related protein 1-like [Scaptodrosophila lebanonensis]|uniref:Golgi-associated plant pathogenesis-related protein 1-like n=1 Tax=Drosophila lebanonensis TaxID=7225 RepID=A0A6J2TI37_DROLE|nr:Golgi-associated plant pathogenesis-related protein 1-like [Scaptodrosophila lebanonensis]
MNKYRSRHKVPHLTLNRDLCITAREYAGILAFYSRIELSNSRGNYGEYMCYKEDASPVTCVDDWYEGIKYYNFTDPKIYDENEAFTQIVWKSTTDLGVGNSRNSLGGNFLVIRYLPPGNIDGLYKENVLALSGSFTFKGSVYLLIFLLSTYSYI